MEFVDRKGIWKGQVENSCNFFLYPTLLVSAHIIKGRSRAVYRGTALKVP
jgi:hypothetical protein